MRRPPSGNQQRGLKPATTNYGVSASLDAAPSFCPVAAIVTLLALTRLLPFFAAVPLIITSSPSFIVVRVHPRFWRPCGGPPFDSPLGDLPAGFFTFTYETTGGIVPPDLF